MAGLKVLKNVSFTKLNTDCSQSLFFNILERKSKRSRSKAHGGGSKEASESVKSLFLHWHCSLANLSVYSAIE